MKKNKLIILIPSVMLIIFLITFFIYANTKPTIHIAVPSLDREIHGYDILKEDLENKFDINVSFVDLYYGFDFRDTTLTEQDFKNHIDNILKNDNIDMIIGVPPHLLEYSIKNDRLLDITDYIIDIDNIHKGVVDISEKIGNGRLFYMSPIFYDIYSVIQNELIFEELGVELLPTYVSWEEFLYKLNELEEAINYKKLDYYPLALGVSNFNQYEVFSAFDFLIQGYGLDSEVFENDEFTERWANFYKIFAEIVARFGKSLEDMEYGRYPKNFIFTNGQYALMFSDTFDIDLFFNEEFNKEYNSQVQLVPQPDFPINVSFINYDGSRTQNIRDTSIAINKNTTEKELAIDILNFLLSEEYALNIIETRFKHSHFFPGVGAFPSFYNEDTIYALNKSFYGFDVGLLYDADYGSFISNYEKFNNSRLSFEILNSAFTNVFDNRSSENLDIIIKQSLEYVETRLSSINTSNH